MCLEEKTPEYRTISRLERMRAGKHWKESLRLSIDAAHDLTLIPRQEGPG